MRIQHNISAINLHNHLKISSQSLSKSTEKLASGFRINRAADDAGGLSISEKMRSQIRGLERSQQNAQDGISLIQVAEGGLTEIHSCLQRIRELAAQSANGTYMNEDRQNIQSEIDSLVQEIDHIANYTNHNNIKLLNGSCSSEGVSSSDKQKFINWLNGSWLKDASQKIQDVTGWKFNAGTEMSVVFEKINGDAVARMSGSFIGGQPAVTLDLSINTNYFTANLPYDGTNGPTLGGIAADRLITHEMVHGYMFNNTAQSSFPKPWFSEGLAEAVHGASDIRYSPYESGSVTDFTPIYESINNFDFTNTSSVKEDYTVGYIATSYLYNTVQSAGVGTFQSMLSEFKAGAQSFEDIIAKYTNKATYNDFITQLKTDANTQTAGVFDSNKFKTDFLEAKCKINLTNGTADPLDGNDPAAGGDVLPNSGSETAPSASTTVLSLANGDSVTVHWSDSSSANKSGIKLQVGDTAEQTMDISMEGVTSSHLNISNISVATQNDASNAIEICDNAINKVSSIRADLGAYQNRLEHAVSNISNTHENIVSSESRIRDVDMAKEMLKMTKYNILMQAAQYVSVHAMQSPGKILQLLS